MSEEPKSLGSWTQTKPQNSGPSLLEPKSKFRPGQITYKLCVDPSTPIVLKPDSGFLSRSGAAADFVVFLLRSDLGLLSLALL